MQRQTRGSMEAQPFGGCWIEAVMRRKDWEVVKDVKRELRRRKEELVLSGGELDTEDVSEAPPIQRRWNS